MKFAAKLFFLIACVTGQIAFAKSNANTFVKLSDTAVYYRCHMQLARSRPSQNDRNLISLRSKKITGPQACRNLLSEASMAKDGRLIQQKKQTLSILRNLQSLHSSWFPQKEFIRDEVDGVTYNIFDANEMGYHFTYNLLSKSEQASSILTRKNSFRGRRVSEQKSLFLNEPNSSDVYGYQHSRLAFGRGRSERRFTHKT